MQPWSRKWMQRARNFAGSQIGKRFCCFFEGKGRSSLAASDLCDLPGLGIKAFKLSPEQVEAAYNARNLQELAATEAAIYLLRRGL